MKKHLLIFIALIIGNTTFSQTVPSVIFQDNFDSYTTGVGIVTQNSAWRTWSNTTGSGEDALITSGNAYSTPNSLNVINGNDIIYNFGNKSAKVYSVEFKMLIKSGNGAYIGVFHDLLSSWAFELYFDENKQIKFENGVVSDQLSTYNTDEWFTLKMQIDITKDSLNIYKDNINLGTYVFSLSPNTTPKKVLGCIEFWGINGYPSANINNSDFLIDDFVFAEMVLAPLPPTGIVLGNIMIPTKVEQGTIVSKIFATDPNPLDTHTFQLVPGYGDNSYFNILNGNLTVAADLNLPGPTDFNIRILATDNSGLSKEGDFVIYSNTNDYLIQNLSIEDVNEISVIDENTLWVESYYGKIARTLDGGKTWKIISHPGGSSAMGPIFAIDSLTAWAVASMGEVGIYKTVDGGDTWTKQSSAYNESSFPDLVYFWNKDEGFTLGDSDNQGYIEIYTTQNGGENWVRVPQNKVTADMGYTINTLKVLSVYKDTVWVSGNSGYLFRSVDKGYTWETFQLTGQNTLGSIVFINGKLGLFSSLDANNKNLYKTQDGGETWAQLTTDISFKGTTRNFSVVPGTQTIAMTDLGSLYFSDDFGSSWVKTENDFPRILKIAFLNDRLGWAGGLYGQLYKIFRNNIDPVYAGQLEDKETYSEKEFNFTLPSNTFTDGNNDPLSFTVTGINGNSLPGWLQFNPANLTFTGTPAIENIGNYPIVVFASDNYNGYASDTFNLEVLYYHVITEEELNTQITIVVNEESSLITIPESIFESAELEGIVTYSATLLNGDPLPDWILFDPATLTITILINHKKSKGGDIVEILITATDENDKKAFLEMTYNATSVRVEKDVLNTFTIYPNPATENLHISLPESMLRHKIIINDLSGRVLYNKEFEAAEVFHDIDVSYYSKGLYIIQFVTADRVFERRVVVK
jgi:photosystem II stability/assembly factor-like uncharacterized protein